MGKQWKQWQTLSWGTPKSLQMVIAAMKLKDVCSLEGNYDQPRQHIKKQRHYFANKGPSSQSYGFSSSHEWIWKLDHKQSLHRRINAFELWCYRRLLRVLWIARKSNQSILKEISPECSLEGLMLKWNSNILVTWCEELTHWKRAWYWVRLKEEGEGDDRGWDGRMASPTYWTWVWASFRSWWWSWWWPGMLQAMCHKESDMTEWLHWTECALTLTLRF